MPPYENALVVNLVGHAAGTLIFGIFLALFLSDRAGSRLRGSWLTVLAAALALTWNAGSLAALLVAKQDNEDSLLAAISFSALSLLPAVLLHISMRDTLAPLRICAYGLSGAAVALHVSEHFRRQPELHSFGILIITMGFGVLTLISAAIAVVRGRTAPGSRLLASMSLALFATSFAHFGVHDGHAWSNELFFHHAGLPLAVFVLLQDLRFLLLDAFLRFLASATLAAIIAAATLRAPIPATGNAALQQSLAIGLLCAAMLLFAAVHSFVQQWLTRTVFRRPNADDAARKLRVEGPDQADEYLAWSVIQLASFLNAEQVESMDSPDGCGNPSPHPASDHDHLSGGYPDWVEAMAPLHASAAHPKRLLLFGRRRGGLRYLSEDYLFLGQMANVISERLSEFHNREMQKLVTEAELRSLQAQINPHFLFNALNTIYGTIPRNSPEARKMVRNLSDIFRYSLQAGEGTVALDREVEIVRAYLEIEQLRFGDRLRVEIETAPEVASYRIPALTLQPLVENAIKHAIALNPAGGLVRLRAIATEEGGLEVQVSDTGKGTSGGEPEAGASIGIENVRRRLELSYGPLAAVALRLEASGSDVTVRFPPPAPAPAR